LKRIACKLAKKWAETLFYYC